ncbi:mitosis initiation protein fs(1)Ya isoform X2 [Anopheles moucheti]|uniref:mitosis initiation protein fs(1)Ya isoform X2 n=1 Tax=Anopheles moucheti TaxID=186751 RepID=UPI0022F05DD9|nr:mitosis initiation protein fs(1)Ya isoform X2 [Anopheles moucheti]
MIIPKEVQCRTCLQVFCCAKCRQKHEDGYHQEDAMLRKICYICNDRPFPLRKDTKITPNNLLIVHILKEHLPLECNRCRKVFYSLADFQNKNNCFLFCENAPEKEGECHLESTKTVTSGDSIPTTGDENKENIKTDQLDDRVGMVKTRPRRKSSLASGDFAEPDNKIDEVDEAMLTPLTKINLRWKRKSRQSFESMLSMTNNTSEVNASGMLRMDGPDGAGSRKLVRTTSTPMYQWQLMPTGPKQPNESYSATLGQMSSIHCSSGSETDSRTEDLGASPLVPNELDKVRAIIRNRSKAVATPLRQVMSKSIQRAIAQHTGMYSKMLQSGTQRKMSFNSTMSSGMNSMIASPVKDPLDLRTTPALKRTSGGMAARSIQAQRMVRSGDPGRETVQLAPPVTVGVTDHGNSAPNQNSTENSEYYETHRDMDSLLANAIVDRRDNPPNVHSADSYPVTPKPSGMALKKVISFQALQEMEKQENEPSAQNNSIDDIWGTPCGGIPARSYSCSAVGLGDTFKAYDASVEDTENDSGSDDVFYPVPVKGRPRIRRDKCLPDKLQTKQESKEKSQEVTNTGGSKLWSIVSNVIRLASRSDIQEEHSLETGSTNAATAASGGGLIQRAASFADYLKHRYTRSDGGTTRTSSSGSEEYRIVHGKKRRRVASTQTQPYVPAIVAGPLPSSKLQYSPVAKRKRIQSRQPIHRLRNTSSDSAGSGSGGPSRWNDQTADRPGCM